MAVKITTRPNGPYLIEGECELVDPTGAQINTAGRHPEGEAGSEATAQDRARGVRRHRARSRRGPGRRRPQRHVGVVLTEPRPHRHLRARDATRSRPAGRLGPADRRRARYQTGVSLLLRGLRGLEADLVVGAVAHRLVAGLAAAAERDSRLARRVDLSPGRIDQLALALDQVRTVRPGRDLDGHRVSPP